MRHQQPSPQGQLKLNSVVRVEFERLQAEYAEHRKTCAGDRAELRRLKEEYAAHLEGCAGKGSELLQLQAEHTDYREGMEKLVEDQLYQCKQAEQQLGLVQQELVAAQSQHVVELAAKDQELAEVRGSLAAEQQRAAGLTGELSQSRTELRACRVELDAARAQAEAAAGPESQMREELQGLEAEVARLRARAAADSQLLADAEAAQERQRRELEEARDEGLRMRRAWETERAQAEEREGRARLVAVEGGARDALAQQQRGEADVQRLEQQRRREATAAAEAVAAAQAQGREAVAALERELQALRQSQGQQQDRAAADRAEQLREAEDLRGRCAKQREMVERLERDAATGAAREAAAQRELAAAQKGLAAAQKELAATTADRDRLRDRAADLEAQLAAEAARASAARQEHAAAADVALAALQHRVAEAQQERARAEAALTETVAELKQHVLRVEEMEQRLQEQAGELDRARDQMDALSREAARLTTQVAELEQRLAVEADAQALQVRERDGLVAELRSRLDEAAVATVAAHARVAELTDALAQAQAQKASEVEEEERKLLAVRERARAIIKKIVAAEEASESAYTCLHCMQVWSASAPPPPRLHAPLRTLQTVGSKKTTTHTLHRREKKSLSSQGVLGLKSPSQPSTLPKCPAPVGLAVLGRRECLWSRGQGVRACPSDCSSGPGATTRAPGDKLDVHRWPCLVKAPPPNWGGLRSAVGGVEQIFDAHSTLLPVSRVSTARDRDSGNRVQSAVWLPTAHLPHITPEGCWT